MIKGETGEHSRWQNKLREKERDREKEREIESGEKCFWTAVRPYKAEGVCSDRRRHNTYRVDDSFDVEIPRISLFHRSTKSTRVFV